MHIDASGRVTMAYQPAFQAGSTTGFANYSGGSVIPFDVAPINIGGHYNTSTYTFTAPVGGTYFFHYGVWGGTNRIAVVMTLNGTQIGLGGDLFPYIYSPSGQAETSFSNSVIITLAANDAVKVIARSGYDASIYGGHSGFGGYLIG